MLPWNEKFLHIPSLEFVCGTSKSWLASIFVSRVWDSSHVACGTCLVTATKEITVSFDVQREDISCSLLKGLWSLFCLTYSLFNNMTTGNVFCLTFPVWLHLIFKHLCNSFASQPYDLVVMVILFFVVIFYFFNMLWVKKCLELGFVKVLKTKVFLCCRAQRFTFMLLTNSRILKIVYSWSKMRLYNNCLQFVALFAMQVIHFCLSGLIKVYRWETDFMFMLLLNETSETLKFPCEL